ncbi:purple acid phosphatase family protein [Nocardioides sp. Kera G14]|uniref:purple acid phosphatase family protein n=1 Tax=Nocardioides sp. Kera G14 TaxID=2884264 RepID=UPI001D12336A|nr:metallophosphoesterase family protein [Nocardioides sp. Kera G14]UDY22620.1 metallophosphoesterase family protein [Nocardioides sp. Kera G14]
MKLNNPRRALAVGACTVTAVAALSVFGITAANADGQTPIDIVLGVGTDQSSKVVSWYYPTNAQQAIEISEGDTLGTSKKKIVAVSAKNEVADSVQSLKNDDGTGATITAQTGYYNAHVALPDLKPNTKYTYHVGAADGSGWSPAYTFYTGTASSDFTFAAFGDPQIGSSGYAHLDGRGWAQTLDYIADTAPETELLVSTGDQVETANSEYEWTQWADPDNSQAGDGSSISPVLKQFTYASQIGNHESGGRAYNQHFAPPNEDSDALFAPGGNTATNASGDYWYIYKDVLFININSNAYNGTGDANSDAAHAAYIKDVVANHGAGTKWQIVDFHHAIYSPASHANDTDNSQRRKDLTYTMSQEGIDMVIQGHDHAYSRSYELKSTAAGTAPTKVKADEQPGAEAVQTGPGGVIYVTTDSASGSKYYDLTAPDLTKNGGDYGPDTIDGKNDANQTRHWANSVESQQYTPTYLQVKVTDSGLQVKNITTQAWNAPTNSSVVTNSGNLTKATAGDKRLPASDPSVHHLQTPGALTDKFTLSGGNSNAFPPSGVQTETVTVPGPTVTATATATATVPGATATVTQTVGGKTVTLPANTTAAAKLVNAKITALTKKIKHAKGTRKAKLKAQLAAFKAVQSTLK